MTEAQTKVTCVTVRAYDGTADRYPEGRHVLRDEEHGVLTVTNEAEEVLGIHDRGCWAKVRVERQPLPAEGES